MHNRIRSTAGDSSSRSVLTRAICLVLFVVSILITFSACSTSRPTHRQSMVHTAGAHVMEFDLDKTVHIFEMTQSGGVQDVVVRSGGDQDQVALIRSHLQAEAAKFGAGDFSDPMSLHGEEMPGVKELSLNSSRLTVEYVPVPEGGRIVFTTSDASLVTAIHRWFGAQLSDHGSDATYR